jgi:hypothetical protein
MSGIATALPGPAQGRNVSRHSVTFKDMGKHRTCASRIAQRGMDLGWTRRADTSEIAGVCSTLDRRATRNGEAIMIVLGIILLVIGYLLPIQILITLGIILIVVGVILELLGALGRPLMGRRHYW